MAAFGKRPLAYVCFVCGQQYGSQSLHIHIPQCAAKWCQQHNRSDPPPTPPELPATADQLPRGAAAINEFNTMMMTAWQNSSLTRCPHCNRTFRLEALEHHSKVCTSANPFKPLPGSSNKANNNSSPAAGRRPVAAPGSNSNRSAGQLRSSGGGGSGSSGTFGSSSRMPTASTCYLCGQQYGSKSLLIHYPQCQDKWIQQQQQQHMPAQLRKPLPQPPAALADYLSGAKSLPNQPAHIAEFNDAAFEAYNSSSLYPCNNCGRTFRLEALEHHSKVCTAANPFKPLPDSSSSKGSSRPAAAAATAVAKASTGRPTAVTAGFGGGSMASSSGPFGGSGQMPKAFICYLCGQQYGSKSLLIHYPQCQYKWQQQQQRPVPDPPAGIQQYLNGSRPLPTAGDQITEFNDVAFEAYNSSSLVPCSNCGRTFRPEALERHARFCTADKPMKKK